LNALRTTELHKRQHRSINALLHKVEVRQDTLNELKRTLTAQLRSERELLYPALLHLAQNDVLDAYESQAQIEDALRRTLAARVNRDHFKSAIAALRCLVHDWAAAEEENLFPTLEVKLSEEQLETLGAELEERCISLLAGHWRSHYRHPPRKLALTELTRLARSRHAPRRHALLGAA
jgi:hemerythrin superfamily protein